MSICINNDLIWISVPKCASTSIEKALMTSELQCKYPRNYERVYYDNGLHIHLEVEKLYHFFGRKETVCITRDWFDRWLSSLEFMWESMERDGLDPVVKWEDIDNSWIYENMTKEYIETLYIMDRTLSPSDPQELIDLKEKINFYFCNKKYHPQSKFFFYPGVLLSQNTFKKNTKCTYEFDITELDKFEEFIQKRYNVDFKLERLNASKKASNKIVKDDALKNWIWENFEKRFTFNTSKII